MNPDDKVSVVMPVAKVVSVWAAVGITSWADIASVLAATYTLLLIGEWTYKRIKCWLRKGDK